jgi:HEAT repeat protein
VITSSKHADVRGEAVQRLSGGGDDVIPMLLKVAFDDPNADVQAEAVDAIKETTGGVATRALRDIAQRHPDRRLRSEARDALDERGIR